MLLRVVNLKEKKEKCISESMCQTRSKQHSVERGGCYCFIFYNMLVRTGHELRRRYSAVYVHAQETNQRLTLSLASESGGMLLILFIVSISSLRSG